MFMSAGDIKRQYQPLEGDRRDAYDPREGEGTSRPETTAGQPNQRLTPNDRQTWAMHMQSGDTHYRQADQEETDEQFWDRKLDESKMDPDEYVEAHPGGGIDNENRTPGYNTFAARASAPQPPGAAGYRSNGMQNTSAWDQFDYNQASYVQRKLSEHYESKSWGSLHESLQDAMRPGGEGFTSHVHLGSQFGPSGKRMVAGAHHRIASMDEIDENRLLPVLHHTDTKSARRGFSGYPNASDEELRRLQAGSSYKYT